MISDAALFARAQEAIKKANRILLISDRNPDGDSVGATTAFFDWLKGWKQEIELYSPAALPKRLLYLDHAYSFTTDPAVLQYPHDLIITFDSSSLEQTGLAPIIEKIPKGYTLIAFDHHATNTRFADINIVFTDATATCEVIHRFFEANKIPLSSAMATSLLAGLTFDTTFFSNSATTARSLEIAGILLSQGARLSDVIKHGAKNKSVPALRLWGLALSRIQKNERLDLALTYFLQKDLEGIPEAEELISGMSNFLSGICGGADAVLVLSERADGTVRGSMRSLTRDVSKIAKLLGGGGHKKAAGFSIPGKIEVLDGQVKIVPAV
ncbi:MAG TPA: DHH family phosphoesterase [Patescibacteria group bacterium]|nr:DHH family phosphoesterase [Patescibacteria group bacterium]